MEFLEILSIIGFFVSIYLYTVTLEEILKNQEMNVLRYIVSFCLSVSCIIVFLNSEMYLGCFFLISMLFFMLVASYLSDRVEKRDT